MLHKSYLWIFQIGSTHYDFISLYFYVLLFMSHLFLFHRWLFIWRRISLICSHWILLNVGENGCVYTSSPFVWDSLPSALLAVFLINLLTDGFLFYSQRLYSASFVCQSVVFCKACNGIISWMCRIVDILTRRLITSPSL